jgi:UDP:flavonoid glycosyltransferase YjiC (YdhE family)
MRLTLFAAGSQGDVQPGIRVGRGLRCAGYNVRLAAPQNFAKAVHRQGLCFQPLPGDVQQIMASEAGRKFMEIGGPNPFQSIRAMRQMLGPVAQQMAECLLETCRDTDALITLAVFAPFGKTVAELRRIPLINFEPTPVLPTRAFATPGWPVQKNLGGAFNLCSGWVMLYVLWQWYHPSLNAFRQRHGLRAMSLADFHRNLTASPLLGAYSSAVIPRPADWPKAVHITGYWSDEALPAWKPSAELEAFLDSGEPPVYVGFGSMASRQPERITRIVLEALEKSGQRGVLATGWGGLKALKVPANVYVLDSAPHSWLFPRMKAVVHHGGAGTTAAVLG